MPDQKLFVISLRCGRMANRLILFANFIAFAEEHGWRVSNVTFHSYAEFFKATRRDIYCRYPVVKRKSALDLIPGVAAAIAKRGFSTTPSASRVWGTRGFPFSENPQSPCGNCRDGMPFISKASISKIKSAMPGSFLFMAGNFARRIWWSVTRRKSRIISSRRTNLKNPPPASLRHCGARRTSSSAFISGTAIIAAGSAADIFSPLNAMRIGCEN
jgi:hypothetical protein